MWSALAESQGCFLRDKYATGGSGSCQVMDACLAPGLSVRPFNDVTGAFEVSTGSSPFHKKQKNTRTAVKLVVNLKS